MSANSSYNVLLYYCYTPLADPQTFRREHHLLCLNLDLRGRIIVAAEGLNGTVSGTVQNCQTYMKTLKADKRFARLDFKVEAVDEHQFQKLNVRYKSEIVKAGLENLKPYEKTGDYVAADELKRLKATDKELVMLDVRSNYEHRLGKFKDALTLDIDHFREFPAQVKNLEHLKNKKIITYCTGGVKCEKASAYLLKKGFKNVYQLHGGIIKYGLETDGEDFQGSCYVFDKRLKVDVNRTNAEVISQCYVCAETSERLVNCANPHCNRHTVICESCGEKLEGTCSSTCLAHPDKRPHNGRGFYPKTLNGYDPYRCSER